MKELELEIGVSYQPCVEESVKVSLRVALDSGEDAEKIAQKLAEKVARIASNQNPDNYKSCMELLGREVSNQEIENMISYRKEVKARIKELREDIKAELKTWDSLVEAKGYYVKLHQLLQAANCWSNFQEIVCKLTESDILSQGFIDTSLLPVLSPKPKSTDDNKPDREIPY